VRMQVIRAAPAAAISPKTVFSLQVVRSHGLTGLGLCNAAMLVGVGLSAPVAARLSVRLDGRALLRVTGVTEAALRVGTFALLLAGAPLVAVAAIEAAGTATAALLPSGPGGRVSGGLLVAVIAGYGACLLPTWLVAGGALVARATPLPRAGGLRAVLRGGRLLPNGPPNGLLAFGGMVVARLERRTLPPALAWPALGIGMAGGWAFAAWSPVALLGAQLLSGMCMSALEGDMDARVATRATSPRGVTAEAGIGWLGGALSTSLAVPRLAGRWSRSAAGRGVGVATARDL
jgi:hypothetical protein